jgi:hypothetical protein
MKENFYTSRILKNVSLVIHTKQKTVTGFTQGQIKKRPNPSWAGSQVTVRKVIFSIEFSLNF